MCGMCWPVSKKVYTRDNRISSAVAKLLARRSVLFCSVLLASLVRNSISVWIPGEILKVQRVSLRVRLLHPFLSY